MAEKTNDTLRKPFKCLTCGRSFFTQNCLQKHHCSITKGQGQEEYCKCDICNKIFYDVDHMRFHTCFELGDPRYYLNSEKAIHPCKFLMFGSCHTVDKYKNKCNCTAILDLKNETKKSSSTNTVCNETLSNEEDKNHTLLVKKNRIGHVPMITEPYVYNKQSLRCQECLQYFLSEYQLLHHICVEKYGKVNKMMQIHSDSDHSTRAFMKLNFASNDTHQVSKFNKESLGVSNDTHKASKFNPEPLGVFKTEADASDNKNVIEDCEDEQIETSDESSHMEYTVESQDGEIVKIKKEFDIEKADGDLEGQFDENHTLRKSSQFEHLKNNFFRNNSQYVPHNSINPMTGINFADFPTDFQTRCKICNKIFSHKGNLKIHMRIHSNERPFECQFCHKSFRMKQNMEIHIRTHTGEKPFKCDLCDHRFTTKQQMQKHMQSHISMSGTQNCEKCGIFSRYEDLHNGICSVCWSFDVNSKQSIVSENQEPKIVNIHLKGESPIENAGNLTHGIIAADNINKAVLDQQHSIASSKDVTTIYNCDICGKVFSNRASLHAHMLMHEHVNWFKCNFCEKQFRLKQTKDVHERIHTGCSPFLCGQCGKTFTTKQNMQKHNCMADA